MHSRTKTISLGFLLLPALVAQEPAPADAPRGFDLSQAHGVGLGEDGVPWAIGRDYKASFRDGAMEFVPALGPAAERNLPLRFRLLTIARGANVLHEATNTAAPQLADRSVRFQRGAIAEVYAALAEGIEQSFVFAERPAGTGDLVVRGAITTAMQSVPQADGTLRFTDGRLGGVQIGAVVGIAADGQRCRGSLQLGEAVLELRLPGAFVDGASYPLVLDPLIGTAFDAGSASADESEIDVAFDETSDSYLAVWRRSFSASDQDIFAQRIHNTGALIGGSLALSPTTTPEILPAVGGINARNAFVVSWQEAPSAFGPWTIRSRSVRADTGALGATISVSTTGTNIRPEVCGDRGPTGTEALVVWHQPGTGMLARSLAHDGGGTLTAGTSYTVASTTNSIPSGPHICKSRIPGGAAVVTWESATGTNTSLWACAVNYTGSVLSAPLNVDFFIGSTRMEHAIDGDGTQFLVAYGSTSVACRSLTWNGSALVAGAYSSFATNLGVPIYAVGFLGDRYLVAWQDYPVNPFDSRVRGMAVKPDCTICSQEFTVASVVRPNQRTPAIATHFAASSTRQDALLMWDETDYGPPFVSSVVGQRYRSMVGATPATLSPACGGGGTAGTNGPFAPGNADFRFTLTGGDPTAPIALLSLADGSGLPISCGCTFTNPLALYAMPNAGGSASYLFPVPCNPQLLGFTLQFQWLLWGAAASPCPLVPNLVASERKLATLTP